MGLEPRPRHQPAVRSEFDAFYDDALPVVHGYLLRLCAGDGERAWDLTQEVWLTFVRRSDADRPERMTIAYVMTIARSRWLDEWRRSERLQRKLRLVWAGERSASVEAPSRQDVLGHIDACSPAHRTVLMLAYIDDLPVAEIADLIGKSPSTTYALLERARAEVRQQIVGASR